MTFVYSFKIRCFSVNRGKPGNRSVLEIYHYLYANDMWEGKKTIHNLSTIVTNIIQYFTARPFQLLYAIPIARTT